MNKHERYDVCLSKIEHLMKDYGVSYEEEIEFLQYVLDQTIFLHEWAKKSMKQSNDAMKKLKERLATQSSNCLKNSM